MSLAVTLQGRRARALVAAGALVALSLVGVAYFLRAQQALTGNLWGVPVDDAYIHFQFARNLAAGHGFAFNPNQPVPGSTSPLWVLLLALGSLAGLPLWLAAKILGIGFLALSALLCWRLGRRVSSSAMVAVAAGAATAVDGRLLWAAPSGMEVTLFAALCLGAFLARRPVAGREPAASKGLRRDLLLIALLCGLASNTRPEGYLLAVVLFVDALRRERLSWREWLPAVALYAALIAPYIIFSLATTGHPLPTTFYAKASGLGPQTVPDALQYVLVLAYYGLLTNPAVVILAPVGAFVLWRGGGEARALVAWPLLLVAFQAIFSPLLYHFGRYAMPLIPFFALWAAVGIGHLTRPSSPMASWRTALPPLALVLVGTLALGTWSTVYARSVNEINTMQVALGQWVRAHVPAGQPVAMNDIGAITYLSGHPAVDVVGLVSPQFIALQRERPAARAARDVYREVQTQGARTLIIFPSWYPQLAAQRGLRKDYSITIEHPIVVGAPTMTVYTLAGT